MGYLQFPKLVEWCDEAYAKKIFITTQRFPVHM